MTNRWATRLLGDDRHPHASWWPERLAAVLAVSCLIIVALPGFNLRTWDGAASDFKTLYAAARLFFANQRSYDFAEIAQIFANNQIVTPPSWYAHGPTYPPFTFAVLAPVIAFPMVTAIWIWMCISAAALAVCIWAMSDAAQKNFGLSRGWRLIILCLVAASPVVSFVLFLENPSLVAAALCIIAVMWNRRLNPTWRGLVLTVSLLLKPHIAFWIILAMVVSRDLQDRRAALRACAFFAAALLCFGLWSLHLPLGLQLHDYASMVRNEIASGCLNPQAREFLPPVAEVTSFESLLGYFVGPPAMPILNAVFLLLGGGTLLYLSRTIAPSPATRLELFGAWSTFGLLATYHRSCDGTILFLLLPALLDRLAKKRTDGFACGVIVFVILISAGTSWSPPDFRWATQLFGLRRLEDFLFFRQSASAALLLLLIALGHLLRIARVEKRQPGRALDQELGLSHPAHLAA